MGIIYDTNSLGKQDDYYHKQNNEVLAFADFIKSSNVGLDDNQIKSLLLSFRGRTGKTRKDDTIDIYKDRIKDHLYRELNSLDSQSHGEIADYLGLKYYNGKDTEAEFKKRMAHFDKLVNETNSLTDEWLLNWFNDFFNREDCDKVIGDRPTNIFWYIINGKTNTIAIDTTCYTDGYFNRKIKNPPKGMKPVVYIYNPACWQLDTCGGNDLQWMKFIRAGVAYVPKKAIFSSLDWLNDPSR